jgi:hypothetical protein
MTSLERSENTKKTETFTTTDFYCVFEIDNKTN